MKTYTLMAPLLIGSLVAALANPASKLLNSPAKNDARAPEYRSESPLPKGWPEPGPFNQVARKSYPAYRAAFTAESRPNGGFWKLFKHIKRQDIPMTSPVAMDMDAADSTRMENMAFLYQSPEVGETGPDGEAVEVRDMPAVNVLSYTWQGGRDKAAMKRARAAVDAELKRLGLQAAGYRVFGYNSPMVPRSKQTHELQALLKE